MSGSPIDQALERAERALLRIERSASAPPAGGRDDALRTKVAEVVSDLDDLIRHSAPAR